MRKEQPQLIIPRPPNEIFVKRRNSVAGNMLRDSQPLYIIERMEYPEDGGIFIYYQGVRYPRKGFPYPEACNAVNIVKRVYSQQLKTIARSKLMMAAMLFKKNRDRLLNQFSSIGQVALSSHFLMELRYNSTNREIKHFLMKFLSGLGIGNEEFLARILITVFEFDDVYMMFLRDLANETTPERLKKEPRKEIKRLYGIFMERLMGAWKHDPTRRVKKFSGSVGSIVKIALFAFLIPKIRRAFNAALDEIDFTRIQMDEIDRFYALRFHHYNALGRTFDDRIKEYEEIHGGKLPGAFVVQPE